MYADLAPVVLGYLRGRGFPDPEDVCGEVFLQVVRDLDRFDGDERSFRSWVLSIAHHRGLDAVRHRARRPVDAAEQERLEARSAVSPDASVDVMDAAGTDRTLALLRTLGEDQREVLALRLVGDLSTTEIAAITGRSREAVKSLQKRAIARLRAELGVSPAQPPDVQPADGEAGAATPPPPARPGWR
ncbi:MAG: sigma-70 family RNA polymerase sigma factor [Nitriliruptor sp.]